MEFCLSCGSIIPDDAVYCPNCGAAGTKYRLEHDEEKADDSSTAVVVSEPVVQEEPPAAAEAVPAEVSQPAPVPEKSAEERYAAAMLGSSRAAEQTKSPAKEPGSRNRTAVTGFVFSVLPIPFILSSILGLIISSVACKKARKNRYEKDYEELAIAGKVLGWMRILFIVFSALLVLAYFTLQAYLRKQGLELNLSNLWN